MKPARLLVLIERYVEGTLPPEERAELEAAARADPAALRTFVREVRTARRVATALRERPPGELWARIGPLLSDDHRRRARVADGVEARLGRPRRRWPLLLVPAAAAAAALALRPAPPPPTPVALHEPAAAPSPAPAAVPSPVPAAAPSPAPAAVPSPVPAAAPAAMAPAPVVPGSRAPFVPAPPPRAVIAAAEGEAFAARTDLLAYAGFDGPRGLPRAVARRLAPGQVELAPGLSGRGLRVRTGAAPAGGEVEGLRAALRSAAGPADEAHLRYYVRLGEPFDYGGGGVLPGVCGGACGAAKVVDPRPVWKLHVRWTPLGELAFEAIPRTLARERRWRRSLRQGVWHAVEVRVRLNTPGASDGVVEGWLDGEKAVSLTGLVLREDADTRIEGIALDAHARKGHRSSAPAELIIDNVALATGPVGLREAP